MNAVFFLEQIEVFVKLICYLRYLLMPSDK